MKYNVLDVVENIKTLVGKLNEAWGILSEISHWENEFLKVIKSVVNESEVKFNDIHFKVNEKITFHISSYNVELEYENIEIPEELKLPIDKRYAFIDTVVIKEFLENLPIVIEEIQSKIDEVDSKNKTLKKILENVKNCLAPIVIAENLGGQ